MRAVTFKLNKDNMRPLMNTIWGNLKSWLSATPDLEIVVRPHKSARSIEQNRRLWKIYGELAENVWIDGKRYSAETWHEFCKGKFIGFDLVKIPDGTEVKKPMSTTKLNTAEMTEYQNKIQSWAAIEFGMEWEF